MSNTGPRRILAAGSIAWGLGALVLGLALVQALANLGDNAAFWLPYPYPRAGSEGLMLYETLLMRRGESLYGPITPDRFISGPYPPLYYLLAGWLLPPGTASFTEGRTLSLWAALTVAAALALLVEVGAGKSVAPEADPKSKIQNPKSPTPNP